jgi:hypothetical protein
MQRSLEQSSIWKMMRAKLSAKRQSLAFNEPGGRRKMPPPHRRTVVESTVVSPKYSRRSRPDPNRRACMNHTKQEYGHEEY